MSIVTVLLTRSATGEAMVATLRDWSAAGQLMPFVWLREARDTLPAATLRVSAGELTSVTLQHFVASEAPQRVRLVALWGDADGDLAAMSDVANRHADALRSMNIASLDLVSINVTRVGRYDPDRLLVLTGFHSLLLSPDDSRGPASPSRFLDADDDVTAVARSAVHAVATIGGLLPGLPDAPFDDVDPPLSDHVRALRVFTVLIDASSVEEALRVQVLSMADGFPLVTENGISATTIENVEFASGAMSDAVWTAHRHLLMSGRVPPSRDPIIRPGLLESIKLFFQFLWAALRAAPGQWAQSVIYSGKQWVANTATRAIFGADSQMQIVVGGVAASTGDQIKAVRQLQDSLPDANGEHQVHHDYGPVWRDVAGGALTLLDGATRSDTVRHVDIGGQRAVMRNGALVAPGFDRSFVIADAHVRNILGLDRVLPWDVLALRQLVQRADAVDPTDPGSASVAACRADALAWWAGIKQTYTAKVGDRLASEWTARLREIARYWHILQEAQRHAAITGEVERAQRRLATWIRIILATVVTLCLATVAMGILAVFGWVTVVLACVVWVILWLGATFTAYVKGTASIFQAKYRRQEAVTQAQAAEQNLRAALADADRLADLYELFQSWAEVLAAFVAKPLGREWTGTTRPAVASEGHALAAQFARAEVDQRRVAMVAHALRERRFGPGWLGACWSVFLESAAVDLGPRGVSLIGRPEQLYRQRAVAEDVQLPSWAAHLSANGASHDAGYRMWEALVGQLRVHQVGQVAELIGLLRLQDGNMPEYADFVAALDHPDQRTFPNELFSPRAILDNETRPREQWQRRGMSGLSELRTMASIGGALAKTDLLRASLPTPPPERTSLPTTPPELESLNGRPPDRPLPPDNPGGDDNGLRF